MELAGGSLRSPPAKLPAPLQGARDDLEKYVTVFMKSCTKPLDGGRENQAPFSDARHSVIRPCAPIFRFLYWSKFFQARHFTVPKNRP